MNEELQLEAIHRTNRKELQTTKQYDHVDYLHCRVFIEQRYRASANRVHNCQLWRMEKLL